MTPSAPMASAPMALTAIDIQSALRALGFDLGTSGPARDGVDGLIGTKTKTALRALQRGRGFPVTGAVDPPTAGVLTAALLSAAPRQGSPDEHVVIRQVRATRAIDEIIVHCTATPEGRDVSVETIRGWHKGKGWKDIGYHWVVGLDGTIRPGRPEAQEGAHVEGHNKRTLGVVYVGGVAADGKTPRDTRTPAQKEALLTLCRALIARYPTIRKVTGHNQYAAKACPSFDVRKDPLGALV